MKTPLELEAEQLAADLARKKIPPEGGEAAPASGASEPGSPSQEPPHHEQAGGPGEGGEPRANPAPMIAAAIRRARDMPRVRARVPARVLAVFDDETIEQLALALGNVLVKYELSAPAWLDRYKDELVLVWVCFCLLSSLSEALDQERAAPREEKEINPGRPAGDPPPHVDGTAEPVS